jgi:hypothetical protein
VGPVDAHPHLAGSPASALPSPLAGMRAQSEPPETRRRTAEPWSVSRPHGRSRESRMRMPRERPVPRAARVACPSRQWPQNRRWNPEMLRSATGCRYQVVSGDAEANIMAALSTAACAALRYSSRGDYCYRVCMNRSGKGGILGTRRIEDALCCSYLGNSPHRRRVS